jgi:hypothetical protein
VRKSYLAFPALACFVLSPKARAATPAPDAGYSGDNTAKEQVALFSRTNGLFKNLRAQLEVRCRCTATMLHHQLRAAAEPVAEALD